MDDHEKRALVDRLSCYETAITDLMHLIDDANFPQQIKSEAQERYRALKGDLEDDRYDGTSSDWERACFHGAIRQASSALKAPVNSRLEFWGSQLYAARLDIRHARLELEKAIG